MLILCKRKREREREGERDVKRGEKGQGFFIYFLEREENEERGCKWREQKTLKKRRSEGDLLGKRAQLN